MRTVITYDIPDDRRRLRVAQLLLDYGSRVQKSVFEAHLTDTQLETLRTRLRAVLDEQADAVRIYRLCGSCAPRIVTLGTPEDVTAPDDVIII